MKKHFLLTLFASLIFSQNITIQGMVIDESGNPVKQVNIYSESTGTTTDKDGNFILEIRKHTQITFSHIAFEEISILSSDIKDEIIMQSGIIKSDQIIVKSGLKSEKLINKTTSLTVFNRNILRNKGAAHFDDLINEIPNLTGVSGTSRLRYFQIRGIGERSQYVGETSPNFSVGYIMDGVDISGLGMSGFLFDTQQIEVLKGPQSSVYGVNSLAGIVNVKTVDPTPFFTGNLMSTIGSDDKMFTNSLAINLPITSKFLIRLSAQSHTQNGFRYNAFSNKNDTNGKNEFFYRMKIHWLINDFLKMKINHFNIEMDNNYDAWNLYSDSYTTYSDRQGKDSLNTEVTSVLFDIDLLSKIGMNGYYQYTIGEHDIVYSYDGDWGNNSYWEKEPYNWHEENEDLFSEEVCLENYGYYPCYYDYDFFDQTIRRRETNSQELRLNNEENTMILGFYKSNTKETDNATGWLFSGDASEVFSLFKISNTALYGQLKYAASKKTDFVFNWRAEQHNTYYNGESENYNGEGLPAVKKETEHEHFGSKIALLHKMNPQSSFYLATSRGFKAGGINQNPYLSIDSRFYEPEYNFNFEGGYSLSINNLTANINLFYIQRDNQQVQISTQQDPGDPNSFYYFTANAVNGSNYGLEFDSKIKLGTSFILKGTLGLLETYVEEYIFDSDTLGGREQAMSPKYNFSIGMNYNHNSGLFAKLDIYGKDLYYYSESHDQILNSRIISNGELGFKKNKWTISFWGKNIFDQRYAVHGFYFALEPPDFINKEYIQLGDPIHFGITTPYQF